MGATQTPASDSATVWAELVHLAAAAVDDDRTTELIAVLNDRGEREVANWALPLLAGAERWQRRIAAQVLGQHGYRNGRPFGAEVMPALAHAARREHDAVTRTYLVQAIGHGEDSAWAGELMSYASDPDAEVRQIVAASLPLMFRGDPMDDLGINTLIVLSVDDDPHVRDWATMSLGRQSDRDSATIRAALRARLADTDDDESDTSGEAALSLAQRGDPSVYPWLVVELAEPADVVGNLVVEAAGALGDVRLLPALYRLRAAGWQDDDPRPQVLDDAIAALEARR